MNTKDFDSNEPPEACETESTENTDASVDEGADIDLQKALEAILFVIKSPMSIQRFCDLLPDVNKDQVRDLLNALIADYEEQQRPFHIVKLASGYQMLTRPEYAPFLIALYKKRREEKITPASLETLSIIAYKQPITRAEIESIRGVSSDYGIKTLLERNLIRVVGREESLGRPMQYGTTSTFLDHFGLSSVKDLPSIEDVAQK